MLLAAWWGFAASWHCYKCCNALDRLACKPCRTECCTLGILVLVIQTSSYVNALLIASGDAGVQQQECTQEDYRRVPRRKPLKRAKAIFQLPTILGVEVGLLSTLILCRRSTESAVFGVTHFFIYLFFAGWHPHGVQTHVCLHHLTLRHGVMVALLRSISLAQLLQLKLHAIHAHVYTLCVSCSIRGSLTATMHDYTNAVIASAAMSTASLKQHADAHVWVADD